MKIKLTDRSRIILFERLAGRGYSTKVIATYLKMNRRTIADWKRGKFNIEDFIFTKLVDLSGISIEHLDFAVIDTSKQKKIAGQKGGKQRWKKYGYLGSYEDKVKGGYASYETRKDKADIFTRKSIRKPELSTELAEFIGICAGDGSINTYQLTISLNDEDDYEYLQWVKQTIECIFQVDVTLHKKKHSKCTNLVVSSKNLTDFLVKLGLPRGDKIRAGLDMPNWIQKNNAYQKAFIRGLFDTDGSIYLETHNKSYKTYSYPRMSIVSSSEALRVSLLGTFNALGIQAKFRNNRSVNIERFTDIEKYFKIIGSSNPKHLKRYEKYGGVG